jgi:Gpi18-like mannosyltransferase
VTAPRTILWRIALLALAARAALEVVGLASAAMHHQPVAAHWLGLWWQWDAHPYLRIAQIGYRVRSIPGRNPFDQYYLGFFPFYPMAVRAATFVFRNRVLSGMIVSYVASVFACWFLYLLVRIDADHGDAWRAVLLLLTFPTAYFLSAPYSEALFLFGVTGAV